MMHLASFSGSVWISWIRDTRNKGEERRDWVRVRKCERGEVGEERERGEEVREEREKGEQRQERHR